RLGFDRDEIVRIVVTAAGLHDIGKASSVFQRQSLASRPPEGIRRHGIELASAQLGEPDANHLTLLDDEARRWVRRHEVAGAVMLHGRLDGAGAEGLAALVAGHHGLWDIPEIDDEDPLVAASAVCVYHRWMLHDPAWASEREQIV